MPQGGRKVAFSGKQKKAQLQQKRSNKASRPSWTDGAEMPKRVKKSDVGYANNRREIRQSASRRFALNFSKEKMDNDAKVNIHNPISTGSEKDLEISSSSIFPEYLDYPKRPNWNSDMSKEQLDSEETKYITEFIQKHEAYEEIGLFEQNLETWRQLWRVCEKADILLIIVDARFAIAQFPPYLYSHLIKSLKKGVIVVLNKCDLIPNKCVKSLITYFGQKFPEVCVVPFSSGKAQWGTEAEKTLQLIHAINKTSRKHVNFNDWIRNIKTGRFKEDIDATRSNDHEATTSKNVLTLGTIGHPNVGKSSFINTIMGKKVVSVSKTPGHTKHFQTIYLTKDIVLCDCPGLVFPCVTPFPLQVIMGSYPIAQVRNPMAIVGYICQYVDVPKILKLTTAEEDLEGGVWSPFQVCEAFASQKNFHVKKACRPDAYRGANLLLRQTVEGNNKIIIYLRTPETSNEDDSGGGQEMTHFGGGEVLSPVEEEDRYDSSSDDDDSSDDFGSGGAPTNKFETLSCE